MAQPKYWSFRSNPSIYFPEVSRILGKVGKWIPKPYLLFHQNPELDPKFAADPRAGFAEHFGVFLVLLSRDLDFLLERFFSMKHIGQKVRHIASTGVPDFGSNANVGTSLPKSFGLFSPVISALPANAGKSGQEHSQM